MKNKRHVSPFIILLVGILTLAFLLSPATSEAKKKRAKRKAPVQEVTVHIPVEVVEALKISALDDAIRGMRLEATSPRSKYLLREMEEIVHFENAEKAEQKNGQYLYNVGVAYNNLYLFLKGEGMNNEDFFKKAVDFYKKAMSRSSPSRKNSTMLTLAAIYASAGDTKNAQKFFKKADLEFCRDEFRKFETIALYYASMGDIDKALENLKLAYKVNPGYLKFWLGISDDFNQISDDKKFQALLKKWDVKPLDRGTSVYSPENEEIVQ